MGNFNGQNKRALSVGEAAKTFALLSDESRLSILLRLAQEGEQNVRALTKACGQSQASTSHHLMLLRLGGIIDYRREGKCNYYFLRSALVRELLKGIGP